MEFVRSVSQLKSMNAKACLPMILLAVSLAVVHGQANTTTVPTGTPAATATPVTPVLTPIATQSPAPTATPPPAVAFSPPPAPPKNSPPPAAGSSPPPPVQYSPPPPPGAGSDKTAVLSVIRLSGKELQPFNATLGSKFQAALSQLLGVTSGSIMIRDWGSSSRRRQLLEDNVAIASAAIFSDGVSAATGLATLNKADQSGALQKALQAEGLSVESASVASATTALPSNFQPIGPQAPRVRLSLTAVILIAISGVVVLTLLALWCCRPCLFCCPPSDEEELPNMIKFGRKDGVTFFFNKQSFKKSPGLSSDKPLGTEMQTVPRPSPE